MERLLWDYSKSLCEIRLIIISHKVTKKTWGVAFMAPWSKEHSVNLLVSMLMRFCKNMLRELKKKVKTRLWEIKGSEYIWKQCPQTLSHGMANAWAPRT
jgi:hypothetical protein